MREDRDALVFYSERYLRERTQRQMVGDLMDRVFGGSVQDLVLQALGARKGFRRGTPRRFASY